MKDVMPKQMITKTINPSAVSKFVKEGSAFATGKQLAIGLLLRLQWAERKKLHSR